MLGQMVIRDLFKVVDIDRDQEISVQETRELLRVILSRPLLTSVALDAIAAELAAKPQPWADAAVEHGSGVRSLLLTVVKLATLELANRADEVAQNLWSCMDKNSDQTVTKFEFCDGFPLAMQTAVLDPLKASLVQRAEEA